MIKLVQRSNLNLEAYNRVVTGCSSGLPYAESWFLDALVGGNWKVLVSGDFEAVMPVPVKRSARHFFKRIIAQPIMCQQLGVYGFSEAPHTGFSDLYQQLYNMRPFGYSFNFHEEPPEAPPGLNLVKMPNYVIPLNKPHMELYDGYSTNLRRNLRKAQKAGLRFVFSRDEKLAGDLIRLKNGAGRPVGQWFKLGSRKPVKYGKPALRLMEAAIEREKGFFAKVFLDRELLSIAFFVKTSTRLVYLIAATQPGGKALGAGHFLVDGVIKKYAGRRVVLDFEGSKVPGIARFFKMFGSVEQPYHHLYQ
ncbi:MAG: GNAT family N-acetyltransferase [Saprospirales bacterium]|nr:MAG: GNAT family N-acetyltransferase [Saprospirales bacterium]